MAKRNKFFNIYFITALIGGLSIFYLLSFVFVLNDVSGGSSREMKKKYCKKNPHDCNITLKRLKAKEKRDASF